MIKPFKSMMIGGLDSKIEEIKHNIDKSLESFTQAEEKLKIAEEQTIDYQTKLKKLSLMQNHKLSLFQKI